MSVEFPDRNRNGENQQNFSNFTNNSTMSRNRQKLDCVVDTHTHLQDEGEPAAVAAAKRVRRVSLFALQVVFIFMKISFIKKKYNLTVA